MMTTSAAEWHAIRRDWRDHRERLGIPDPLSQHSNIEPAGLASRVEGISTRILILPADLSTNRIEFDEAFWEWWCIDRRAPFGSPLPWTTHVPTVHAAASVRLDGREWSMYLAVHRHGGIEIGTTDTHLLQGRPCFRLIRTVGLAWLAVHRQADVLGQVAVDGPWEVTLALYGTEGAHLGNLAEGWSSPGGPEAHAKPCPEPNLVIQEVVHDWPGNEDAMRGLAFRLGARIEDGWGITQRRFLAGRGDRENGFDARNWAL